MIQVFRNRFEDNNQQTASHTQFLQHAIEKKNQTTLTHLESPENTPRATQTALASPKMH